MKSFVGIFSSGLLVIAIGIIGFGIYNMYQIGRAGEKSTLPRGPNAGILYILLGIGLLLLAVIRRFKK